MPLVCHWTDRWLSGADELDCGAQQPAGDKTRFFRASSTWQVEQVSLGGEAKPCIGLTRFKCSEYCLKRRPKMGAEERARSSQHFNLRLAASPTDRRS